MKFISFFKATGLAIMILVSSSCFDVQEEYIFRKDGSGSVKMIVDMSSMIEMMKMFSSMSDSSSEDDPMASLNEAFDDTEALELLKGVEGISNIKSLNDKEKGIIGYSYDFKNIDALNDAMANNTNDIALTAAMGLGEGDQAEPMEQFLVKGRKFTRNHGVDAAVKSRLEEEEASGEESELDEEGLAGMMFGDASWTIKYTFEEGVKKCKHDHASITSDGKSVLVDVNMKDLLMGESTLSTKIKTR